MDQQRLKELEKDIAELETFLNQATRQKVKDILSMEQQKLESQRALLVESLKKNDIIKNPSQPSTRRCQVKLSDFGWDQSPQFIKFFVTIHNVHTISLDNVVCHFDTKNVELEVTDLNNKDYLFCVKNLLYNIIPANSFWKVKKDKVIIFVAKEEPKDWSHVTKIEKASSDAKSRKFEMDKSAKPEDSLMGLMKNMYEEGDDEMKRTIAKVWTESQSKKTQMEF